MSTAMIRPSLVRLGGLGRAFKPHLIQKMEATTSSALLAQLLEMGFEEEQIEECQLALSTMGATVTLQSATEWYAHLRTRLSGITGVSSPKITVYIYGRCR